MSSVFELGLKKIGKELTRNTQYLGSELHQTSDELAIQMRIEFFVFRFQKLSGSQMGLHWGVDIVSFMKGESAYDLFNILALRE